MLKMLVKPVFGHGLPKSSENWYQTVIHVIDKRNAIPAVYASLQFMQACSLCKPAVYASLQFMQACSLCKPAVYASLQFMQACSLASLYSCLHCLQGILCCYIFRLSKGKSIFNWCAWFWVIYSKCAICSCNSCYRLNNKN